MSDFTLSAMFASPWVKLLIHSPIVQSSAPSALAERLTVPLSAAYTLSSSSPAALNWLFSSMKLPIFL